VTQPARRYLTEAAGVRICDISTDLDQHIVVARRHATEHGCAIITSRQLDRLDRRRQVSFQRVGTDLVLTGYEGGHIIPLDSDSTEPWMTELARRAVELAKENP